MIASIFSALIFGVVRFLAMHALYRHHTAVRGLSYRQITSWLVLSNVFFTIIWTPWISEFPRMVRSGEIIAEFLHPINSFVYQLAQQLGRLAALLITTLIPACLIGFILFPPVSHAHGLTYLMFGLSILLLVVSSFSLTYVVGCTAFFTSEYHMWASLAFYVVLLFGGMIIPVEFYPGVAGSIIRFGPGMAFVASSIRILNNVSPLQSLVVQGFWTSVLFFGGYFALTLGRKRLVAFGG